MKLTAYGETRKCGSRVETEFEVDDDILEGLDQVERDMFLRYEATRALLDAGLVSVRYEESPV